jgi:hypothetical protein
MNRVGVDVTERIPNRTGMDERGLTLYYTVMTSTERIHGARTD